MKTQKVNSVIGQKKEGVIVGTFTVFQDFIYVSFTIYEEYSVYMIPWLSVTAGMPFFPRKFHCNSKDMRLLLFINWLYSLSFLHEIMEKTKQQIKTFQLGFHFNNSFSPQVSVHYSSETIKTPLEKKMLKKSCERIFFFFLVRFCLKMISAGIYLILCHFLNYLSLYNSSECPRVLKQLKIQASSQHLFQLFCKSFMSRQALKKPQLK